MKLNELVIELTDRCPQVCKHCSSCSSPSCSSYLSKDVLRKILAETDHLKVRQISFGGGEPTIAPLFSWFLNEVVSRGISSEIFTCGINYNHDGKVSSFSQDTIDALAQAGPDCSVIFSIHGADASSHDYITQTPGSFELMMQSIKDCQRRNIRCLANCVPMACNKDELPNMASLVHSLGIPKLSLLRFVPQGRGLDNRHDLEMSNDEEDSFVAELVDLRRRTATQLRTGSPFNGIVPESFTPCRAGISKIVVQADGNVIPCEVFKHNDRNDWGASVYEHTIQDIIKLPAFIELRKKLLGGSCRECPVHSMLRTSKYEYGVKREVHV